MGYRWDRIISVCVWEGGPFVKGSKVVDRVEGGNMGSRPNAFP